MPYRLRSVVFATSALIAACSSTDRTTERTAAASVAPAEITPTIAHRDPRIGAPTFAWFSPNAVARFQNVQDATSAALAGLRKAMDVHADAMNALGTPHVERAGQSTLVRFKQRVADVDVFRAGITLALRHDLEPVAASGFVVPSLAGSERAFSVSQESVVAAAVHELTGSVPALRRVADKHDYQRFEAGGLVEPARAKRVFYPLAAKGDADARLEPAYYVEVQVARGPARSFVLSAIDGRLLFQNDLVRNDAYTYRAYADPTTFMPMDGPQGNELAPHPTGKPDHTKLSYVPSQLVTLANYPFSKNDPWLPPGATSTTGNNVIAYADLVSPDGYKEPGDVLGATSAASKFDFTYDTNASPGTTLVQQRAAITQLFYVLNFLHDWYYDAGFDEKSGNHQTDNFGRGGRGGDELFAEAQDYSGRNNANAAVPADGSSPRIQMFVFAGTSDASLVVNSPASVAGTKTVGVTGGFGKDLFDTTGAVVLGVDEGGTDANDGCEPLAAAAGKIVFVHRGTCSFIQKAQNAQAAGAIGALIANVASSTQPTVAPFMGGTAQGITIPVLSLNEADGAALEAAIKDGLNVTMKRIGGVDLDGALDTSIVTHEWGHVLSGRLVGDGNGLTTNQAGGLGEGWGDFTALLLQTRKDDPNDFGGAYTNGSYAMSGGGDDIYFGTRRVPYSVDVSKNPLTFKHIQNGVPLPTTAPISFGEEGSSNAEVHNTGEVWATMLWECYVALLRDSRYTFEQAQDRMKRYLVASLKLTPPDPTLLEARDAVIAAALATDEADAKLFWDAFARRGAGAGAEGPGKDSPNNVGVKESFTSGNAAIVTQAVLRDDVISCDHDNILDEGEVATIELTVKNSGSGTLADTKAQISSKTPGVSLIDQSVFPLGKLAPFQTTSLKVKTSLRASAPLDVVALDVTLSDPTLGDAPVVVSVPARYQADEAAQSSATDDVETTQTPWKATTDGSPTVKWARAAEGANHFWSIANGSLTSDNRLTSPAFHVEGTTFSVSYKHRFLFRFSTRRQVDLDGGVVELSIDGGKTWKDISTYGAVDYNTTLDTNGRGNNPLKGRKAYGNKSKGYPTEWMQSKVDVTLPAPTTDGIFLRFRAGNGDAFIQNGEGWDIDDIAITGASDTPFTSFVPHGDNCDPNGPSVDAGPGKTVKPREVVKLAGSGTHPADAPLTFMWRQVAGPAVTLHDETTPTPSFDAPADPTTLAFELRAHDGKLLSAASRVEVKVAPDPASPPKDDSGCSCDVAGATSGSGFSLAALAVALVALRRRRR